MNTEQLQVLSDRLEGLSGADREVDALIACAFDVRPEWALSAKERLVISARRFEKSEPTVDLGKNGPSISYDRFTASLDAVVALVERVLPGAQTTLIITPNGCRAWTGVNDDNTDISKGSTAPLALLRALVVAKIGEGK